MTTDEEKSGRPPKKETTSHRTEKKRTGKTAAAEQRKAAQRKAAEDDARDMLLAAGHLPEDEAALVALLKEPPGPEKQAYTIPEFCEMYGFSVPTYGRWRDKGETPVERIVFGQPRIFQEDIDEWKKFLDRRGGLRDDDGHKPSPGDERDGEPPPGDKPRKPLSPRDGRLRENREAKEKKNPDNDDVYDPLPRKPRRPSGRPPRNGSRGFINLKM